ncbi:MAG: hypothetical protein A2041_13000 [Bacteroidetes bacterium GWA2_31_9b]|nr:MAG: hypothetical protein A2041_13000 [Bacteroidetes bacterium GWA2_31_9b]
MKTLNFKTSLKCAGCVNAIKPSMDKINEIISWNVDLNNPEKIVEVVTDSANEQELSNNIMQAITLVGYKVEKI